MSIDNFNKRNVFSRLENYKQHIKVLLDFYFDIIEKFHKHEVYSEIEADNQISIQMIFSKGLNILKILEGVDYKRNSIYLNRIIDPTILFTLVRNLYEAVCSFELINIIPKTQEEKEIIFNLYCISGYNNRQRFFNSDMTSEQIDIYQYEKKDIEKRTKFIKECDLYKNEIVKKLIDRELKHFNYQIILGNIIKHMSWREIAQYIGFKEHVVDNLYGYFCLNAHPSYIAHLQFENAFTKQEESFMDLAEFACKNTLLFLSVFIADYMKIVPEVKQFFKEQPIEYQKGIDYYNRIFRGEEYSNMDF